MMSIKDLENIAKNFTEEEKETLIHISVSSYNKLILIVANKNRKNKTKFTPRPKTKFTLKGNK